MLTFDKKHMSFMRMITIFMLLEILSTFSYVMVNGWPTDSGVPKSTTWAPGWGVLIDTITATTTKQPPIVHTQSGTTTWAPGWGVLIDPPDTIRTNSRVENKVPVPTPTTTTTQTPNNGNKRPSVAACHEWMAYDPAGLTEHILGGKIVAPGDYPHVGALIGSITGGSKGLLVLCGSSLIAKRFVLTAAHCVSDPLKLPMFVRFGVVNWKSSVDRIDVKIAHIHVPTSYRFVTGSSDDIAIIELEQEVDVSTHVKPACLNTDLEDLQPGIQLAVTGWGVTNLTTRAVSDNLLATNVTTVNLKDCNATFIDFRRQYELSIRALNEGQYCANDPNLEKDACIADSGGPLQFIQNKLSTIVGVVSYGHGCGSSVPSIYARVAFYLDWIESIVWPNGII